MKNNIKVIIFDLGGIVVPYKKDLIDNSISKLLKISKSELKKASCSLNNKLTKGEINLNEFYSRILEKIGNKEINPAKLARKHIELYKKYCSKWDFRVLKFIEKLKKKYQVACLVNAEIEIVEINRRKGLYDIFSKSFISTDMKMMKPNLNIYKTALKRLGIKPKEAVFIDDKEENINSAIKLGIKSILYKDFLRLKRTLKFLD